MIIHELTTTNYRQHRGGRTWPFNGNLVGVIGPNGSGKSHLIDAIEFLFTGKVGGQNKSDMLSWGEQKGRVSGTFVHDGNEGSIARELHGNGATFEFRGTKASGITSVNAAIASMTGMDAEICRQAVFVHQKEIDAILFTDPSIRQLAWQRLCGLSMANGIHTDLGTVISKLPPLTDWSEQIEGCETRIKELDRQIKETRENLEITKTGLGAADYNDISEYLDGLTRLSALVSRAIEGNKGLTRLQQSLEAGQPRIKELKRQFAAFGGVSPQPKLDECRAAITAGQQIVKLQQDLDGYRGWEKAYSQQLAALMAPACDQACIDGLGRELASRKADEAVHRSRLALHRQLHSALCGLNAESKCPLCAQVLAAGTDLKAMVEQQIAEIETKARTADNDARRIERQIGESRFRLNEYDTARAKLETSVQSAKVLADGIAARLGELKVGAMADGCDQGFLARMQESLQRLEQAVRDYDCLTLEIAAAESAAGVFKKSISDTTAEVDGLLAQVRKEMAELTVSDPASLNDLIAAQKKELDKIQQVNVQIGALSGQLTQMQSQLQNLGQTLEDLQRKKAAQANQHEVTQTLTRVRDWFHYTNGPQTVINSLHGRITAGVNDFLKRFGASFYVMPDAGSMSFRYCYHDGRPMPEGFPTVDQLSGGEAVVLAVSFRLATYCLFAGRVGLLTLDEPTVYLDDKHISQFCTLLSRVKEIATGMNLQIFVSTHEQSVIPFMDSVVNLNPKQ